MNVSNEVSQRGIQSTGAAMPRDCPDYDKAGSKETARRSRVVGILHSLFGGWGIVVGGAVALTCMWLISSPHVHLGSRPITLILGVLGLTGACIAMIALLIVVPVRFVVVNKGYGILSLWGLLGVTLWALAYSALLALVGSSTGSKTAEIASGGFRVVAILAGGVTLLRHAVILLFLVGGLCIYLPGYALWSGVKRLWPLPGEKKVAGPADGASESSSSGAVPTAACSGYGPGEERRLPWSAILLGTDDNVIEAGVPSMILAVLFVTLAPVLTTYVEKAHYAVEAIPTMGMIRTKIALFRYEFEQLPGVGLSTDGDPLGTSQLAPDLSRVQTVASNNAAFTADFSKTMTVAHTNHFLWQIEVDNNDLSGHRLRPQHFQYRVDACKSNRYLYAIGVFGDGKKLKAGTGYAVLEMRDGGGNDQIAVWNRYKRVSKTPTQVIMVNAEEATRYFKCQTPKLAAEMNLCWIGDPEALMSSDPARVKKGLDDLRRAGWRLP